MHQLEIKVLDTGCVVQSNGSLTRGEGVEVVFVVLLVDHVQRSDSQTEVVEELRFSQTKTHIFPENLFCSLLHVILPSVLLTTPF